MNTIDIVAASELLGNRLKTARLAKNLTQAELARLVDVPRGKIVKAEKGIATINTFLSILFALNNEIDVDKLVSEFKYSVPAALKRPGKSRTRASKKSR